MISVALSIVLVHSQATVLDHVREALAVSGGTGWKETRLSGKANYYGVPHDYSLRQRFARSVAPVPPLVRVYATRTQNRSASKAITVKSAPPVG